MSKLPEDPASKRRYRVRCMPALVAALSLGVSGYVYLVAAGSSFSLLPTWTRHRELREASSEQVHEFCGACHAYSPPDIFPRSRWKEEVGLGYAFYRTSGLRLRVPPINAVTRYYESRAPEALPVHAREQHGGPLAVRFERIGYQVPGLPPTPAVSNVRFAHLSDPRKLDVLVCDMRFGLVMVLRPYEESATLEVIAQVPNPAHAEVVDLDQDDIPDVLVANLGSFEPTDRLVGSVVWLRGTGDGKFVPITLLEGVGRVADVQAADFDGDGDLDLVVAAFGWRNTGEILYLENRTTDWSHPVFVPRVLDARHGAIHVPVADLNGDGRPDFVSLISQEHETVVAFLNEGGGQFRRETIYTGPHPAYGSSGIELVDLDGDGDLDVLYSNGDSLDSNLLKPYHTVQWLENRGQFPFVHHTLAPLYGAHRALAADFDGDGDLDVIAVSLLPAPNFPARQEAELVSIILLAQGEPGKFVRHSLETITCDHITCDLGDYDGDGKVDLVVGNFCRVGPEHVEEVAEREALGREDAIARLSRFAIPDWIVIWQNLGSVSSPTTGVE